MLGTSKVVEVFHLSTKKQCMIHEIVCNTSKMYIKLSNISHIL